MIRFYSFSEQNTTFLVQDLDFPEQQLRFIAMMKNITSLFGLSICVVCRGLSLCVLCFIRKLALDCFGVDNNKNLQINIVYFKNVVGWKTMFYVKSDVKKWHKYVICCFSLSFPYE